MHRLGGFTFFLEIDFRPGMEAFRAILSWPRNGEFPLDPMTGPEEAVDRDAASFPVDALWCRGCYELNVSVGTLPSGTQAKAT